MKDFLETVSRLNWYQQSIIIILFFGAGTCIAAILFTRLIRVIKTGWQSTCTYFKLWVRSESIRVSDKESVLIDQAHEAHQEQEKLAEAIKQTDILI